MGFSRKKVTSPLYTDVLSFIFINSLEIVVLGFFLGFVKSLSDGVLYLSGTLHGFGDESGVGGSSLSALGGSFLQLFGLGLELLDEILNEFLVLAELFFHYFLVDNLGSVELRKDQEKEESKSEPVPVGNV